MSAYRVQPYKGLVEVLDLGLMAKILLSHFLIGLQLFHVKSGQLGLESELLQRVKGPTLLNRRPKIISCQKVDDSSTFDMK